MTLNSEICKNKKYKAVVDKVYPDKNRKTFRLQEKCFLGVSLENCKFKKDKLDAILYCLVDNFDKCELLIGDSVYRFNLDGYSYKADRDYFKRSVDLGREFIECNSDIFEKYGTFITDIKTCSKIQECKDYVYFHNFLNKYYTDNSRFKESVRFFSEKYFSNKPSVKVNNNILQLSSRYFLEEFSVFSCMCKNGNTVMVYPGTFSTLYEVANGEHQGAPEELKLLTYISVAVKGR